MNIKLLNGFIDLTFNFKNEYESFKETLNSIPSIS